MHFYLLRTKRYILDVALDYCVSFQRLYLFYYRFGIEQVRCTYVQRRYTYLSCCGILVYKNLFVRCAQTGRMVAPCSKVPDIESIQYCVSETFHYNHYLKSPNSTALKRWCGIRDVKNTAVISAASEI